MNTYGKRIGLISGIILLLICAFISLIVGKTHISLQHVWSSFTHFDGSNEHLIVQTARLPRTLIALVVGGSLAIAGVMIQSITRNPLASPSTLGINAGASFFIVLGLSFISNPSFTQLIGVSFIGAGVTFSLVYILGSMGKVFTPLKMTLAGASINALFASLTHGLLVTNEKGLEEILFWLTGSVSGRRLETLWPLLPFIVLGWIAALVLAKQFNIMAMGEEVAIGLGQRTQGFKWFVVGMIVVLAGASVAIAGPIVFIGLITPHLARFWVGNDHRWVIPYAAILGALLLLISDILGRVILPVEEIPVGVMTAIIGAPVFIYLARRK